MCSFVSFQGAGVLILLLWTEPGWLFPHVSSLYTKLSCWGKLYIYCPDVRVVSIFSFKSRQDAYLPKCQTISAVSESCCNWLICISTRIFLHFSFFNMTAALYLYLSTYLLYHTSTDCLQKSFTDFLIIFKSNHNKRDPEKVHAPVGMNVEAVQSSSAPVHFFYYIHVDCFYTYCKQQ